MAGGKIKGISKKEGGEIQKFEWGQRRGDEGREKKQSGGLIPFLPLQRGNADRLFEGSNEVAVITEAAAFVYLRHGKGLRKELLGQRDFFCYNELF